MSVPVVYDGPHAAADVPSVGIVGAVKGRQIEVSPEVAKGLLASGQWKSPESADQRKAREQDEQDRAEQDRAAEEAAAEVREKVAAEQAERRAKSGGK